MQIHALLLSFADQFKSGFQCKCVQAHWVARIRATSLAFNRITGREIWRSWSDSQSRSLSAGFQSNSSRCLDLRARNMDNSRLFRWYSVSSAPLQHFFWYSLCRSCIPVESHRWVRLYVLEQALSCICLQHLGICKTTEQKFPHQSPLAQDHRRIAYNCSLHKQLEMSMRRRALVFLQPTSRNIRTHSSSQTRRALTPRGVIPTELKTWPLQVSTPSANAGYQSNPTCHHILISPPTRSEPNITTVLSHVNVA